MIHDMGNRLHIIAGRANRLRNKVRGCELTEQNTSIIIDQVDQAERILQDLSGVVKTGGLSGPRGEEDNEDKAHAG
jgi:hypothetical protein